MAKGLRVLLAAVVAAITLGMNSPALAAPTREDAKWTAKYWNNVTLSGDPVVQRTESNIDHDWGQGAPVVGVTPDNFSARWRRIINFQAGTYRFTATSDDGIRVWLDDKLIIDAWNDHPVQTFTKDVAVTAGEHRIRVEYYERAGGAVAQFSWGEPGRDADDRWQGRYYNGTSLSGEPRLTRSDKNIDFDWGEGRPADGVDLHRDQFSVKWTRDVFFEAGTYRFVATSDDGIRVWVDDQRIINQWTDHPATTYTADLKLTRGVHRLRVEYYENTGSAVAKFSWGLASTTPPPPPADTWRGEYFNNTALSGAPVLTRNEAVLDFNWGNGGPGGGVQNDLWSARWTRTAYFPTAGTYRFTAVSDDGIRVWVDNKIVIDRWYDHAAETFNADVALSAGNHTVKVEYYENAGLAQAKVTWALGGGTPPPAGGSWRGQYYNNTALSGTPVLARDDTVLDFNWANGGPGGGVQNDKFSARWTRTANFAAGTYRFTAVSDDGIRVWVDDKIVIDRWYDHAAETYVADVALGAGNHTVKVEYYENAGLAQAKVTWAVAGTTPPPASSGVTAVVNTGALNIRSGPGVTFSIVGRAYEGQSVSVLARSPLALWVYVDYQGVQGWMYAAYLKFNGDYRSLPIRN